MKNRKRKASRNKNHINSKKSLHRRRQKTNWQFEQLETRFVFSTAPLDYTPVTLNSTYTPIVLQTSSLSSDTIEGAEAIWLRELDWAIRQAAASAERGDVAEYEANALPNDPMFPYQWHLLNTGDPNYPVGDPFFPQPLLGTPGEDINVVPVWNLGYTGEGVVVAVIDTGVQLSHPDLADNLHSTLRFNAINGSSNPNPNPLEPGAFHGTAVAGIIAAVWNNAGDQAINKIGTNEYPVFDRDGNPVLTGGGTGVAPNAILVPIKMLGTGGTLDTPVAAFEYAWMEIDITNNSWGLTNDRNVDLALSPEALTILRNTIRFGRDGLGTIHVFSSGNSGGPAFTPGFESFGNFDSAAYAPWVSTRYTIGVTGVDHDGLYANFDGTFTSYPEAGADVLVAAPTGSNVAQNVANDQGQGSGIFTTDLLDNFGANSAVDPTTGLDVDFDWWPDADYTARMNGTSAAAPVVSGVIALMLEANPNLTYRDVQEILVRSARQNAQFEIPSSGGIPGVELELRNTWQTNQLGLFRNPDPWSPFEDPVQAQFDPIADPNFPFGSPGSRELSHFEAQPALYANGAGYTVSQGYGVYDEQIGYAHGVVDAELAVQMALQWHTLGQDIAPNTEKSFTTFVLQPGANIPAAERLPLNRTGLLIPGGIGGRSGFSDYWNEYYEDDPFADYTGPFEDARGSYLTFNVPDNQAINLEWVEVKVEISGPPPDFDFLRILLVSPDGTQSDLSNYYYDPGFTPFSTQDAIGTHGAIDPAGNLSNGTMLWTFSTNRIWGERTSDALIYDPITGEPILQVDPVLGPQEAFERGWELHIENWSTSDYTLDGLEIVWHGKPLAQNTQRVQGIIGIDENSDGEFNYTRYDQSVLATDPTQVRSTEVVRDLHFEYEDANGNGMYDVGEVQHREGFAANMLVEAFRVVNGVPESNAIARFLTGADGNYYFDLVPAEYVIRVTDPLDRVLLDDVDTAAGYLRHYQSEWHITEDWFYAQDREVVDFLNFDEPPEVLFDDVLGAPVQFLDGLGNPIQTGIRNLNFLVKDPAPVNEFVVNGNVFADINANGQFDGNDVPFGGVRVYWDQNQNGIYDAGELDVLTSDDPLTVGTYTLTIPAFAAGTFSIGVVLPSVDWAYSNPANGIQTVYARPGDVIGNINNANINDGDVNFFLDPPNDAFPPGGNNLPGNILGTLFIDKNGNGIRDPGDNGLAGFRVFIDANENGIFDGNDIEAITSSLGTFSFSDLPIVGSQTLFRIAVEHDASWQVTSPSAGYLEVAIGPGGTVTGKLLGLKNLADRDWGNLPESFSTSASANGPSHFVVEGFHLGTKVFGEIDGVPSPTASDNDGVILISNGGVLQPLTNTVRVTVAGLGGILNAWIDFDGDGSFVGDPAEQIFVNVDLNPGTYDLTFSAPSTIAEGMLGARFRWGEFGLGFTGPATIGEVEDYLWSSTNVQPSILPGDYNNDGVVNAADYVVWRDNLGSNAILPNDATGGGGAGDPIGSPQYDQWNANFGATSGSGSGGGGSASALGDSSGDGSSGIGSPLPSLADSGLAAFSFSSSSSSGGSQNLSRSSTASPSNGTTSNGSRNAMLDLALATLVTNDDSADAAFDRELFEQEEEGYSELALTVALEEGEWWEN